MINTQKRAAAERAAGLVTSGMIVGLGTGSTAALFVETLAQRISEEGLDIIGIPTSEATFRQARDLGIPLTTLDEHPAIDLTIDGADELDAEMRLIKGGGGALLREKIVAKASARMIVIADDSKDVTTLGRFPLPIEVIIFGQLATERAIAHTLASLTLSGTLKRRTRVNGDPFITDSGHHIVDASLAHIPDPEALNHALNNIPGVVEHGLFIKMATGIVLATQKGLVERGEV